MIDIGIPEIIVTAKYEDTDGRSIKYDNVFPDEFTFFPKRQHLTNRLKDEIVNRCIKGETFRYIATDYGIDPNTVSAVFKEY